MTSHNETHHTLRLKELYEKIRQEMTDNIALASKMRGINVKIPVYSHEKGKKINDVCLRIIFTGCHEMRRMGIRPLIDYFRQFAFERNCDFSLNYRGSSDVYLVQSWDGVKQSKKSQHELNKKIHDKSHYTSRRDNDRYDSDDSDRDYRRKEDNIEDHRSKRRADVRENDDYDSDNENRIKKRKETVGAKSVSVDSSNNNSKKEKSDVSYRNDEGDMNDAEIAKWLGTLLRSHKTG